MTDKTLSEQRRDKVLEVLTAGYPDRMDRSEIRRSVPREFCDDGPLDNAIHVLKKRCIIARTDEGYQLVTAPEWYNQKLVDDANAAAVKVSPLDAKPLQSKAAHAAETRRLYACAGKYCATPVPEGVTYCDGCFVDAPAACSSESCDGAATSGADPALCGACDGGPVALDAVAVRRQLAELQERLTADPAAVNDIDLKLEVLEGLGRILDDGIEAVLLSIAGDLRG